MSVFDFGRKLGGMPWEKGKDEISVPRRVTVNTEDVQELISQCEVKTVDAGPYAGGLEIVANPYIPRGKVAISDQHGNVVWFGNIKADDDDDAD